MFSAKQNKNTRLNIGKIGENLACEYLVGKAHKIVDRNYLKKFGEIDIVALSSDKTLIFCEVKTMAGKDGFFEQLKPEDNLTFYKARKMRRIGQFFAAKHPELIDDDKGWRIDLVVVVLSGDLERGYKAARINHYENV